MMPNEPRAEGTTVGRKDPECPNAHLPPAGPEKLRRPRRLLPEPERGNGKRQMKNTNQNKIATKVPPEEGGPEQAEIYPAPRPPSKGRIIAIDCHPDTFTASVWRGTTPHDAQKLEERLDMKREELDEWLGSGDFGGKDLVLMEAGSNSFELARSLRRGGLEVAVLESRKVGKFAKDPSDNDRMASERIAMAFLAGQAPCVWIPDKRTIERRRLLAAQQNAARNHVRAVNVFKNFLNTEGVRLGRRNPENPETLGWVKRQKAWSRCERELLEFHWREVVHHAGNRKRLVRMMCRQVAGDPLMLRLMELLGISHINAFAIMAVVGDVRRFSRAAKLVAYLGLNPGHKTSGKSKLVRIGVGRRGRGDLRALLTQAAQVIMRRGKETKIGAWGWKLFLSKGKRNVAVSAVARKLAIQIWHLLSGNPPVSLEPGKRYHRKLTRLLITLGAEMRKEIGLPYKTAQAIELLMLRVTGREPEKCPT